eukprot:TRINITY_DN63171_c0_g1_i1.p2 TRINITY_DN63171_c0_g1~~TRINITY_DN63171_c0_g1_i1.p2  ORF type:complete len:126 (-),score=5.00 TRINITY_DN63171_c0_g1_i1:23-400(-)
MKSIAIHAFVFAATAISGSAFGAESYGNGSNICLEIENGHFGVNLLSPGNTHEILGNGAIAGNTEKMLLVFVDSFENKIEATFNKASGTFEAHVVSKGEHTPTMVLATYGTYQLRPSSCTSSALP